MSAYLQFDMYIVDEAGLIENDAEMSVWSGYAEEGPALRIDVMTDPDDNPSEKNLPTRSYKIADREALLMLRAMIDATLDAERIQPKE